MGRLAGLPIGRRSEDCRESNKMQATRYFSRLEEPGSPRDRPANCVSPRPSLAAVLGPRNDAARPLEKALKAPVPVVSEVYIGNTATSSHCQPQAAG